MTINSTDPLSKAPGHAAQHNAVNGSVANLSSRVGNLEAAGPPLVTAVQQARRTAHEWVVRGGLVFDNNLLLPILWNLTAETVEYEAAKMTVYTPSTGSSIKVDLVAGDFIASGKYISDNMATVLTAPMEILVSAHESRFYTSADFTTDMAPNTFLAAYITQVGSGTPGADLTIQLNRLL